MANGLPAQFEAAKEAHPGMVLLWRRGDWFEAYRQDAETVSKALGLVLIRGDSLTMTFFHHHTLEKNLPKLLAQGHRVAICEIAE